MESEIQTQLENIVKAIEKLDSPDWWSIAIASVIAVVNAGFMIWIGIRQNKLQKQQNELQERQIEVQEQQNYIQGFEMHKMMYRFVMETNAYAHIFIPQICHYLQDYDPYEDRAPLIKLKEEVDELAKDFEDKFVDINIQLSFLEALDYDTLICDMKRVVEKLEDIIDDGGIKKNYTIKERILATEDTVYVEGILSFIKDEFADEYRVVLEEFVENKNYITSVLNSYIEGKVKNISF